MMKQFLMIFLVSRFQCGYVGILLEITERILMGIFGTT